MRGDYNVNVTGGTSAPERDAETQALLDAAAGILATEGPEALSVRRIAARAGCSTMLVYSRLGGKHGVVEALFVAGFERLAAEVRAGRTTADPIADLRRCAQRYRRFALDHPTSYAVMFERAVPDFEPSTDAHLVAAATLGELAIKIERAIREGFFPDQDPLELAACLWAALHGVVTLELKGAGPPDIDWPRRFSEVVDAMLRGLAVDRG